MGDEDDLTVAEAAEALGTSPQTVRALLRKGELAGRKRPWGSRYVWVPSRAGVDYFLSVHGRLDGHRRRPVIEAPAEEATAAVPPPAAEALAPPHSVPPELRTDTLLSFEAVERPALRPFVLRPRGRATVVVVVLGVPLLLAYGTARILPGALWFNELDQSDVFRRLLLARVEFFMLIAGTAAVFMAANLGIAARHSDFARTRPGRATIAAASFVTGTLFASSVEGHWQTFLLWQHRQSFGVADPVFGKDVGYFVFSLPFERLVSALLLWLIVVAAAFVALVYRGRQAVGFRPPRATFEAQVHLASLTALFLLVVAWRIHLERYILELRQPSADGRSFAGAGYVDAHIRLPGLGVLVGLSVVLALTCVAAPFVARTGSRRRTALLVGAPAALLVGSIALLGTLIPSLVQRYVVDPNPLVSEQPYLERSIEATRAGLGLDAIDVVPYTPTGRFTAADFAPARDQLSRVPIWDTSILEARMRELVTDTPYYQPEAPTLDVVRGDGRRQLTVVSERELDQSLIAESDTWINNRLAYTHGMGLIRFSSTDVDQNRGPRLIDAGPTVREPRIYFGHLPLAPGDEDTSEPRVFTVTTDRGAAQSPWILVNTHRPEVDLPASGAAPPTLYSYTGTGGIELSTWVHRLVFALALGSKEMVLSDDITPESRILLHRDVNDRLHTLAPFIQWDTQGAPLSADGRVVFVVEGYTTSANYPYADRVDLAGTQVNYARASVRATVDAFSGQVHLYLTNEPDPIAQAWAEAFPTLFEPDDAMPAQLRDRLRYPADLFDAQAAAYETFHVTRPDLYVSNADAWARPIALSGPIDVAGDVDFDESDEDDLRSTMQPGYVYSAPPGRSKPRLLRSTFYTPRRGQNLVATLAGWIDGDGRARLTSRAIARDPVTLGPAQMSRLTFANPRVRNLLGLRNLEIRDLEESSLDTVILGEPHLLFSSGGIVQVQSLFEGSRGPGAARLLGVTTFLNGRAGLGPDIYSAVRQALNKPPRIDVLPPTGRIVKDKPVELAFLVENARREVVTITTSAGSTTKHLRFATGQKAIRWVPPVAGEARVRVEVTGLDGTDVSDSATFRVLNAPPTIRLIDAPTRAVVGRPVRVSFKVSGGVDERVTIATRSGIVFSRAFLIRGGTGVVKWTPTSSGWADLLIRAQGHQGQTASASLRLTVEPRPPSVTPPTVTLLTVPGNATVGRASTVRFRASDCDEALARIAAPGEETRTWRFPCPAPRARFTWTPTSPGRYVLSAIAHGDGTTAQATTQLTVVRSR